MKKRSLVREILRAGFIFERASQRHERYVNKDGVVISLGRHDNVKPWEYRDAKKKLRDAERQVVV